eukprot:TRINITY_DN11358_c0_g2_i2.p1 TRINITY_DN11358_c0_g2~~TRINITY_DN11358_c0_g2_i2.p1  ORF type:complete len:166 (+),score=36.41 TRINITY_DN11358_c0_g2_i2:69-566(+)
MKGGCKELGRHVLAETKWLSLKTISYVDSSGTQRSWDVCERTTTTGTVDGVDVLAVIKNNGEEKVVIELQYRPPLKKLCLEFPSGLVDEGETPGQAALRELKEETGYFGELVFNDGLELACEPGLTSAITNFLHVTVNTEDPKNSHPQPELQDGTYENSNRLIFL